MKDDLKNQKLNDDVLENVSGGVVMPTYSLYREGVDNVRISNALMDNDVQVESRLLTDDNKNNNNNNNNNGIVRQGQNTTFPNNLTPRGTLL